MICKYYAAHYFAGIPATTQIDCGKLGTLPCCEKCAQHYAKMITNT